MFPKILKPVSASNDSVKPLITFQELRHLLVGSRYKVNDNVIIPVIFGGQTIKNPTEKRLEAVMESCGFKTVLSGVMGGVFGAAIGLFTASVGPDVTSVDPAKQTVRQILGEMKFKMVSQAKTFAMIGMMFAAAECTIESVRHNPIWPIR